MPIGYNADFVTRGTKVVTVVQATPLRLELTVPEQSIGLVTAGQSIQLQVDAFPGRVFEGQVRYVSPALLPIIIGAGIIALAVSILVHALKEGGAAVLREMLRNLGARGWEGTIRFLAILVPLISLVFMNLQRIDFFLCIMLFLNFMISVFYLDDARVLRRYFTAVSAFCCATVTLARWASSILCSSAR